MRAALETYSNVHRGTGHHSAVTTVLYEQAREIVLEQLGLNGARYVVVFLSPHGADRLEQELDPDSYRTLSTEELGLPLGVRVLAVERGALRRTIPGQAGGGTVKMVSPESVIWADAPDRFEAGTPGIVNVIATACALRLTRRFGKDAFRRQPRATRTAGEILYQDGLSARSGLELLRTLGATVIGAETPVPTRAGTRRYTNLDNAASTPTFSAVWDTVCQTWRQPEKVRREIVREVKQICAAFVGAPSEQYDVIFTSNTTEAINIAASSLRGSFRSDVQPVVVNSWLEHNSNELPWRLLSGASVVRLSVDDQGFVDLEQLARLLREYNQEQRHGPHRILLVALSGASNVLGSFNDLERISRVAHQYGARLLVDAAQMAAHRRIEMGKWGIDYLAFSGHKLYAPFGSGVLVARKPLIGLDPFQWKEIKSSGEENVVGIAALGKAIVLLDRVGMEVIEAEEKRLTLRALGGLARTPGIELWGVLDPASPRFAQRGGILAFSLKGVPHNLVAQELAEQGGIGVRSGCHCAHLLVKRLLGISALRAKAADFGLVLFPEFTAALLPGLLRVSLGIENDDQQIDHLLRTLRDIAEAPRSRLERLLASTHNGTPFLPRMQASSSIERWIERVYG